MTSLYTHGINYLDRNDGATMQRSTSSTAGTDELTRPLYSSSSPQSIHFSTSSLLCSSLRLYLTVTRACRRWRLWPGDWGPPHTLFTRRPTRWAAIRTMAHEADLTREDGKRKVKQSTDGSDGSDLRTHPPKNPPKSIWALFSNQESKSKFRLFLKYSFFKITNMKTINLIVKLECF